MKLEQAVCVEDMARLARQALPRIAYDFIDGGVEGEVGLARNRSEFDRYKLLPRYLVDVAGRPQTVTLFGREYTAPFGVSPMGLAGFFRKGADLMIARAAAKAGVPYIMSSASCDSIEAAVKEAPGTTWFQIYGTRNPDITMDLVRRARALDVPVLVMTIDTPVIGKRERNMRNGFRRPMKMTPDVILQGLSRPAWTLAYLREGGIPMMQNWQPYAAAGASADDVADLYGTETPAPGQTWEILEAVRAAWPGPLAVKGVLHPDDARRAQAIGADGLVVSNHGGRQLDSAPAPIEMLPAIVEATGGRMEILVDSGVRRGSDIGKLLCLGARAALVGRPAMFGAAAAGEPGVAHVFRILRQEIDLLMGQMGWPDLSAARPECLIDTRSPDQPMRRAATAPEPAPGHLKKVAMP
ncbi:alpha-hydroxy acid oxidase [Acuticoccus sediminis]|uniref:alpha-hydroxy acid oxidase n=1 Tax=Acuticoccus sediminis TaxID=2184697 RepID=UPI001CFEE433|nr:alpha-hydroxy acid oxidase [Acuticoccus sediminis]